MKHFTAQDFGYKGHELLQNLNTGSIDTASNWAADAHTWLEGSDFEGDLEAMIEEIKDQFSSLEEVEG